MKYKVVFILILSLICSCSKGSDYLFYIEDFDDFVYMSESTNLKTLKKNNSIYLTKNEKENHEYTYRLIDNIFENKDFYLVMVLSHNENLDLNSSFILRSIDKKDNSIIDSFYFSGYNRDSGVFCSGFLSNELDVRRKCDHGGDGEITSISIESNGKFIDQ